jgi:hypothetical protein
MTSRRKHTEHDHSMIRNTHSGKEPRMSRQHASSKWFRTYLRCVVGILSIWFGLHEVEGQEYAGLARLYQRSDAVRFVSLDNGTSGGTICITPIKPRCISSRWRDESLSLVDKPGAWLVFAVNRNGQLQCDHRLEVGRDSPMTTYMSGLSSWVDSGRRIPVKIYYKWLDCSDSTIADDSLIGFSAAPLSSVTHFASTELRAVDVIKRLGESIRGHSTDRIRLYSVLLAWSSGELQSKQATLKQMLWDLRTPDAAFNMVYIDGVLAGLLRCEPETGWQLLKDVLFDSSVPIRVRLQCVRAVAFGLDSDLLQRDWITAEFGKRLADLVDVYPEIIQLSLQYQLRLTPEQVGMMVTDERITPRSDQEFGCHLAVARFYLVQEEDWRSDFMSAIRFHDPAQLDSLKERIRRRAESPSTPYKKIGSDVHRPDDGSSCYLGTVLRK